MKEIWANISSGIGITDIIDILVVAYIVYMVLGFIRETRAQQLVKGVLALIAVFLLSDLFNLYTLNWIMRTTMTIGLVALIILFQPELRRALEYMGRGTFGGRINRLNKTKAKRVTDAFVDAVDSFSETRTGALIVIEQETSLGDVAETGTLLNAEISAELLGNIFYKGSPLHDGAVLIRGDQIYAAGCVLPLTTRLDINKELGTRHRSAIGITENSDAVALVVSEETGVISMAKGGKLTRFMDTKEVEKALLNIFIEDETEEMSLLMRLSRKVGGGNKDAKE